MRDLTVDAVANKTLEEQMKSGMKWMLETRGLD